MYLRRALCHMEYPVTPVMPGHWKVFPELFSSLLFLLLMILLPSPERSMSRMRVSIGVLPTSLTKNNCSITEAETVRREGSLRRSLPNLVGWLGYWVRQYSSRAH